MSGFRIRIGIYEGSLVLLGELGGSIFSNDMGIRDHFSLMEGTLRKKDRMGFPAARPTRGHGRNPASLASGATCFVAGCPV